MIRIFIADDSPVVRKGLANVLSGNSDLQLVNEAGDGKELISRLRPDIHVLLLDLSLPGRHGLELVEELRAKYPRLAVLIFTIHDETAYVVRAAKAGAAGYLTKGCSIKELLGAIRQVASGHKYFTGEIAEKLACHLESNHQNNLHEALSVREMQVLLMIAAGKTIKDIACELSVSPKTVTTYRARLLEKLGLQTNADLIHYTIKEGLALTGPLSQVRNAPMEVVRNHPHSHMVRLPVPVLSGAVA